MNPVPPVMRNFTSGMMEQSIGFRKPGTARRSFDLFGRVLDRLPCPIMTRDNSRIDRGGRGAGGGLRGAGRR